MKKLLWLLSLISITQLKGESAPRSVSINNTQELIVECWVDGVYSGSVAQGGNLTVEIERSGGDRVVWCVKSEFVVASCDDGSVPVPQGNGMVCVDGSEPNYYEGSFEGLPSNVREEAFHTVLGFDYFTVSPNLGMKQKKKAGYGNPASPTAYIIEKNGKLGFWGGAYTGAL